MKLPRDLNGDELVRALGRLGYAVARQTGSHVRMVSTRHGKHAVTIPQHRPLKVGTLAEILGEVAQHAGVTREELVKLLNLQ